MKGAKAMAQPTCADQRALLRQLQVVRAVAKCLQIAIEHGDDDQLDLADAVAGLLILVEGAAIVLDRLGGAP